MDIIGVKMHGRQDDDSDFVLFDLQKDVKFIEPFQMTANSTKTLAFHTSSGSFIAIHLMRDARKAYREYGFESLDSSTIVNTTLVKRKENHGDGGIVYFEDGSYVKVRRKFTK